MGIAQLFAMASFANFAVLINDFTTLWQLSSTQAGWISGIYFAGYVTAVPVLVGLTDALDARRIYVFGLLCGFAGSVGYALFADGFVSAMVFRFVAGISLAGTYMPGLQIINDRLQDRARQRVLPWYLSIFSIGTAASYYFTGLLSTHLAWQEVFLFAGVVQALCIPLIIAFVFPKKPDHPQAGSRHPLDFRPVFKNKGALAYIWGYVGHTYELFAYRAWIVAFLIFAAGASATDISREGVASLAAAFSLLGMPASLIGAQICLARSRRQTISIVMVLSVALGSILGFMGALPFIFVVILAGLYSIFIMSDSAALTGGVVAAAREGERGATLAMHSVFGFSGGFLGPLLVGWVLDMGAGPGSTAGWGGAFLACAAGSLVALIGMRALSRN
ncbi:MAG: MFS transporter [Gammaproteobacteria bacterium]|nr:MFS transporter [Gammaproteobacteria bacterium]NDA15659.1 MFS transporter [Gammaproteobacteria bacterium]NDG43701.1 MFS transporter [Gammaproteobacteria bacterium]